MSLASDSLPRDVDALQAIIAKQAEDLATREAALDEVQAALDDAKSELQARDIMIAQLKLNLDKLKRFQFGRSSEKLQRQIDQLELALEDLETGEAVALSEPEHRADKKEDKDQDAVNPRRGRQKLPAHLRRQRTVLDPGEICPDCGGRLRLLGEDINEILDYVAAKLKVLQVARLKKSCRLCEKIVQEPAPSTPIPRAMAGANLLSHILVSKFDDHLPLYRQREIFARLGIDLPRSTVTGWVGAAIAELRPLAEMIKQAVLKAPRLHCDDTIIPVLDAKRKKTKEGRIWVMVRDDRPYQGADPPAAVYFYSPNRKGAHPQHYLKDFKGVLQADGFAGFNELYKADPRNKADPRSGKVRIKEAACWAHFRRKFWDFHQSTNSPIAQEALDRIGELYDIERAINGQTLAGRQAERDAKSRPLVATFKTWLEVQLPKIPGKSDLAKAIRYGLSRWQAFTLFLDDATVAIDNNAAERAIRPLSIGRKNWLFAGSDRGAENAATIMTLIETAKLNDLNPETYLADILDRLPDHKINRLEELLPWNWKPAESTP